jgi:hypothetical protein
MKRILTLLFMLGGLAFAVSAQAQTDGGKKPKKKDSTAKDSTSTQRGTSNNPSGGHGSITIDEGGQSRPTKGPKKPQGTATQSDSTSTATPKNEEQKSAERSVPAAPASAPMAIDEGGQSRPRSSASPALPLLPQHLPGTARP